VVSDAEHQRRIGYLDTPRCCHIPTCHFHGARSGRCTPSPSGRSAARATVGGEFPTGTLSVVPRLPHSPMVHVSASPPLIPDGRLSRVRLAASDVRVLSQPSLPRYPEAQAHARIHPARTWFSVPVARGSVDHSLRAQCLVWCHLPGHHWTESPFAPWRRYLAGDHLPVISAGVTLPSSLLRAHAPDLHPLTAYAQWLDPRVFAGCCVPLLGRGPSRCSLLNLCGGAWTRTPPRFCGALTRCFPQNFGLT
jgi:hypothetical protein